MLTIITICVLMFALRDLHLKTKYSEISPQIQKVLHHRQMLNHFSIRKQILNEIHCTSKDLPNLRKTNVLFMTHINVLTLQSMSRAFAVFSGL